MLFSGFSSPLIPHAYTVHMSKYTDLANSWNLKLKCSSPDPQGWQVCANSGLNRSLNRFKPSCQKQVFASFYQTWYNNCSIKIMLTVTEIVQ